MKGHDALIAMRLSGAAPLTVDLIDGEMTDAAKAWPVQTPRVAVVSVLPDEPLHGLDLRCLVALPVQVSSGCRKRLGELLRRVKREQPARLIGALFDDRRELVEVYDSEGVATWRKC